MLHAAGAVFADEHAFAQFELEAASAARLQQGEAIPFTERTPLRGIAEFVSAGREADDLDGSLAAWQSA